MSTSQMRAAVVIIGILLAAAMFGPALMESSRIDHVGRIEALRQAGTGGR